MAHLLELGSGPLGSIQWVLLSVGCYLLVSDLGNLYLEMVLDQYVTDFGNS